MLLHQIIDQTQTQNSDASESCDLDIQTQSHSCGCACPLHGNQGSSTVALLHFCANSSEEFFFFFVAIFKMEKQKRLNTFKNENLHKPSRLQLVVSLFNWPTGGSVWKIVCCPSELTSEAMFRCEILAAGAKLVEHP